MTDYSLRSTPMTVALSLRFSKLIAHSHVILISIKVRSPLIVRHTSPLRRRAPMYLDGSMETAEGDSTDDTGIAKWF